MIDTAKRVQDKRKRVGIAEDGGSWFTVHSSW